MQAAQAAEIERRWAEPSKERRAYDAFLREAAKRRRTGNTAKAAQLEARAHEQRAAFEQRVRKKISARPPVPVPSQQTPVEKPKPATKRQEAVIPETWNRCDPMTVRLSPLLKGPLRPGFGTTESK
jgi:hypothetical protein